MNNDPESAKNYAFRLLKFRPRSRSELEVRLKRKKYSNEIITQLLDFLTESGLINDALFAKVWISNRLHLKPRSRALLRYELKRKGIAQDIIDESLGLINEEKEEQIARGLAERKFLKINSLPKQTIKARLNGYLARRGFKTASILKIINELVEK